MILVSLSLCVCVSNLPCQRAADCPTETDASGRQQGGTTSYPEHGAVQVEARLQNKGNKLGEVHNLLELVLKTQLWPDKIQSKIHQKSVATDGSTQSFFVLKPINHLTVTCPLETNFKAPWVSHLPSTAAMSVSSALQSSLLTTINSGCHAFGLLLKVLKHAETQGVPLERAWQSFLLTEWQQLEHLSRALRIMVNTFIRNRMQHSQRLW